MFLFELYLILTLYSFWVTAWQKSRVVVFNPRGSCFRQKQKSKGTRVQSRDRASQECLQEWAVPQLEVAGRAWTHTEPREGLEPSRPIRKTTRAVLRHSGNCWWKQKSPSKPPFPFLKAPSGLLEAAMASDLPRSAVTQHPGWFLPRICTCSFLHQCLWCTVESGTRPVMDASEEERQKTALLTSSGIFPPPVRRQEGRGSSPSELSALLPLLPATAVAASVYLILSGRICTRQLAVLPQKALRPWPAEQGAVHRTQSLADHIPETRESGESSSVFPGTLPSRQHPQERGEYAVSCLRVLVDPSSPDQALRLGANYKRRCTLFLLLHNRNAHNTYNPRRYMGETLRIMWDGFTPRTSLFSLWYNALEKIPPDFSFSHLNLSLWQ